MNTLSNHFCAAICFAGSVFPAMDAIRIFNATPEEKETLSQALKGTIYDKKADNLMYEKLGHSGFAFGAGLGCVAVRNRKKTSESNDIDPPSAG